MIFACTVAIIISPSPATTGSDYIQKSGGKWQIYMQSANAMHCLSRDSNARPSDYRAGALPTEPSITSHSTEMLVTKLQNYSHQALTRRSVQSDAACPDFKWKSVLIGAKCQIMKIDEHSDSSVCMYFDNRFRPNMK